jgi:hypothetical protein
MKTQSEGPVHVPPNFLNGHKNVQVGPGPLLCIRYVTGIRCLFDPGSQANIFDSLMTNFWVKSTIIIYNFMLFVATKNGRKIFFPLLHLVGSGIRHPGSEIRDLG